jgi:hypothetical protein
LPAGSSSMALSLEPPMSMDMVMGWAELDDSAGRAVAVEI